MFTSDDEHDRPLIRNEDTLRRRAWIDRALAGVRDRLKADDSTDASVPAQPIVLADPALVAPAEAPAPRRLYVVRNRQAS